MKANKDKQLEKMVDKLMKETSMEMPLPEFTSKLMMQVYATEMDKATVYKPLISKKAWFIIFGSIIVLTTYLFFNTGMQTGSWLANLDLTTVNNVLTENLAVFKLSEISLYAVVLLTVMLFVQITFIKRYFNKRFEV